MAPRWLVLMLFAVALCEASHVATRVASCAHGDETADGCVCADGWIGKACNIRECAAWQRVVDGECACPPPFVGEMCDECPELEKGEHRVCAVLPTGAITPLTVT